MCCKNSDARGPNECKRGQAPFPYGPRRKFVCCQCPTGKVLNREKNGCMSTEVPSSSPTVKPSLSPTYEPTTQATYLPSPAPSEAGTSNPTRREPDCMAGFEVQGSYVPLLYRADSKFKVKGDPEFLVCCREALLPVGPLDSAEKILYIEAAGARFRLNICHCILGQQWYPETFVNNVSVGPYCGF